MEYKQSLYEEKTWLPYSVVADSFENKWERSLCFFIHLRKVHKKPIFYNFTLKKVSENTDYCIATVKRHLDILKSKGLVEINGKNLSLKGTNRLKKEESMSFLVPVKYSKCKKKQLTCLRYVVIKRNIKKQVLGYDKALNAINSQNNYLSLNKKQIVAYRRAVKFIEKNYRIAPKDIEKEIRPIFILSNMKFGSLINRKYTTGLKLQQELNELGFLTSSHRRKFYHRPMTRKELHSRQEYLGEFTHPRFQLAKNGYLYERLANKVEINENFNFV